MTLSNPIINNFSLSTWIISLILNVLLFTGVSKFIEVVIPVSDVFPIATDTNDVAVVTPICWIPWIPKYEDEVIPEISTKSLLEKLCNVSLEAVIILSLELKFKLLTVNSTDSTFFISFPDISSTKASTKVSFRLIVSPTL